MQTVEAFSPCASALGIKNVIATVYSPNNKIIMIEIPDAKNLQTARFWQRL